MAAVEQRKSPRIIVDLVSVEVYAQSEGSAKLSMREICPVRNISEHGMMFEDDLPFTPGEKLRLTFTLPDSPIMIHTDALVIHCLKKRPFEVGVLFKNLGLAEQKLLQHFINKALAKGA